ncbi:MAG: hypothetical protein ACD_63C00125G0009 [uncultured bacterium]|nr:MAG: hypothetical protein ACD_63C00125G0009 [uncultured bacterium]
MMPKIKIFIFAGVLMLIVFSAGCIFKSVKNENVENASAPSGGDVKVNLESFKKLARGAVCADKKNELFLIDGRLVFWTTQGNCNDSSYSSVLFEGNVDNEVCSYGDSIAGPMETCDDEYKELFQRILSNLDASDLGLGDEHKVEAIPL